MTFVIQKENQEKIHARTLGSTAREVTAQAGEGRLLGTTSQGAFVLTRANWVFFLTGQTQRGPLTVNLETVRDWSGEQTGDPVLIGPEEIIFPKSGVRIFTGNAEVWSPPPPAREFLPAAERHARLDEVARLVSLQDLWFRAEEASDFARAIQEQNVDQLIGLFRPLLGRGAGLTPAGDDFVLGALLALNRWGDVLQPGFPVERLNPRVVEAAKARTTTLSANLIECAGQGLADERLIAGLDGVVTGQVEVAACAGWFNAWGSTSGANVFAGIQAIIQNL